MSKMGIKINCAELLITEHGWSHDEVAQALSVSTKQIRRWERNNFITGP